MNAPRFHCSQAHLHAALKPKPIRYEGPPPPIGMNNVMHPQPSAENLKGARSQHQHCLCMRLLASRTITGVHEKSCCEHHTLGIVRHHQTRNPASYAVMLEHCSTAGDIETIEATQPKLTHDNVQGLALCRRQDYYGEW